MFSKKYIILYLILLFLLARLYLLFAGLENLIPSYPEGHELYRGTVAKLYMDGSINSLFEYQQGDHNGISTFEALAAIPFFYVFGPYLFSLKLAPLAFMLATMVLWFLFVKRHINIETAIITAILFIFAPPSFISYNLTCGFHSTPLFFDILAITLFFKMINQSSRVIPLYPPLTKGDTGGLRVWGLIWHVVFGISSGFALWVDNVFAITLVTCIVFWFIHDKLFFFKKTFASFVIGFFVGFSPVFYYAIYVRHLQIFQIFEYSFKSARYNFFKKFLETLTYKLPYSFWFKDFIFSGVFLNYLYYAIFVAAFIGLIWFQRKPILRMLSSFLPKWWHGQIHLSVPPYTDKQVYPCRPSTSETVPVAQCNPVITVESFFLSYILMFILIFSLSRFGFDAIFPDKWHWYRFFTSLYPFIFVTIAIGLNKLLNTCSERSESILKPPLRLIYYIFIFILITAGIVGIASQTSVKDFGKGLTFKGYSYEMLGVLIRFDYNEMVKRADKIADGLYKDFVYYWYGYKLAWSDKLELSASESLIHDTEEVFRSNCYEGLGLGYGLLYRNASSILEKLKTTNFRNKDYKKYFLHGIATGIVPFGLPIYETVDKHIFIISQFDPQSQPHFYQGLGIQLARMMGPADIERNLLKIDEANRKYCYIGIGHYTASRLEWAFADKKYYIGFDGLNKDYWPDCYYGLGWGIGDFFEFDIDRYVAVIKNNVSPEYMEYCFKGLIDRLKWKFGDNDKKFQKMTELFPEPYKTLSRDGIDYFALDGSTVRFYDESHRKHLVKGWSSTEGWGTWSEGEESLIILNFKEPKNHTMLIKATGFSVPGKQQSVRIYLDDNLLGEHTFTHPTTYFEDIEIKIPSAYIKKGNQRIRFVYSFAGRPVDHRMGPDLRQLAMGVSSIEFK